MEVIAIRTARVIVHLPTEEINPFGKAVYPDLTRALVERYGFMAFPQTLGDYDEEKGIVFGMGRWKDISIDRLSLFGNGIAVDTRSSTKDSEEIINEGLLWMVERFGLTFKPEMMNRKGYLSELVVHCDKPLNALNPRLAAFANTLTDQLHKVAYQSLPLVFETTGIALGFDSLNTKFTFSPFRYERLVDVPLSENKFYAGAPLPTNTHIELLELFEGLFSD